MLPSKLTPLILWLVLLLSAHATQAETSSERKGRKAHEKLSTYTHFYNNKQVTDYVNEIGQKLVAVSEWPDYPFRFFVVDSPGINAFAADGGYIYVNRGLLSFMTSEAQLAAVLAHEIAHVTKRHLFRQRFQQRLGNTAAFVSTWALLNSDIGDVIRLENQARVSGFGRDMELEADEYGAQYLYKAGYDPQAIIEVLGILKDHQEFSAKQALSRGRSPITYHGVFSTHPRNDQRLREIIAQAGELPPGEAFVGRDEYREAIDGMVFGENDTTTSPPGFERYSSKALGVTFAYPDDWTQSIDGQNIVLTSKDGIEMRISVSRPDDISPDAVDLLKQTHQVDELIDVSTILPKGSEDDLTQAAKARINKQNNEKRVALVKIGANAFFFESITPTTLSEEVDEQLITVIQSFRKATSRDFPPADIKNIYFKRLEPGETFAELAKTHDLGRETVDYLRLINGYYPSGEAQPGIWIKMAK